MHSQTLRIVAGICLILSAGVFINVIFLQERYMGGRFAHPERQKLSVPQYALNGGPVATEAGNANRHAAQPQPSQNLIRDVQRALAERKYYNGQLDGRLTIYTRAAIMDYQTEHRLPITAEASETLLGMIVLGLSLKDAPSDQDMTPQAEHILRHTQMLLERIVSNEVRVTGLLDPATISAIRRFERQYRLLPKGHISQGLLVQLESVAAAQRARQALARR